MLSNALTHFIHKLLLVISLVNVTLWFLFLKEKMSHCGGGGGSKKCGKSVTYYLNGPLSYVRDRKTNNINRMITITKSPVL
jgi:hypothetical protein